MALPLSPHPCPGRGALAPLYCLTLTLSQTACPRLLWISSPVGEAVMAAQIVLSMLPFCPAPAVPWLTKLANGLIQGRLGEASVQRALARDAVDNLERLGPTYIKLGQIMSIR